MTTQEIKVIKRNGDIVDFNEENIKIAIEKAMNSATGLFKEGLADKIANEIKEEAINNDTNEMLSIYDIEEKVYYKLVDRGNASTARAYEGYKAIQAFKRVQNTTDDGVIGLLRKTNDELMEENSNKNPLIASTQRDLIAGEVSKDIARRKLIPTDLLEAHDNGTIHIHDMDYIVQPMFNCEVINMKDMLDNGTVINGKMIESPKSFQVACNVMTQIVAQVASNQYGGQSIDIRCLSKYLRAAKEKNYRLALEALDGDEESAKKVSDMTTKKELEAGVQSIQYQINTLMTSNGQAPFVTLFMHTVEDEYIEETVAIIEEIIRQRIVGIKNEVGVYVTPAFPKLIYVLDENNIHEDSEYRWLTDLSVQCTVKRLYPDYISAKIMRKNYEGNVFSPMGCRAFLSPWKDKEGNYQFDGRFNMGVTTINLPQIGIVANGDEEVFFKLLEKRLELCKQVGILRYDHLKTVTSDSSPIHWQHGAVARLQPHESIEPLLKDGYSTVTLGYIGIYEATLLTKGVSHTDPIGKEFALKIMKIMNRKVTEWKEETGLAFALYGTPAESLCYRFASIDKEKYGDIKDVTDKGYYTNSFHVDVRENINVFDKFDFESSFQELSKGGCISYAEIPNMSNNTEAVQTMVEYIYDHIQYAEFNTKSDYCHVCGFDQEIIINENNEWECPQCGNQDKQKMNVTRRTCGYLGENFWNEGKTKEIASRVLHI